MKKQKKVRSAVSGKAIGIRIGAVVLLLLVAAAMLVIGRGHTIYPENKTFEYEGKSYEAFYKVTIWDGAEKVGKLKARDRGQVTCIGQTLELVLDIEREEGDSVERIPITVKLPYSIDNLMINVPALVAGLPQDVFMDEFIITVEEPEEEETPGGGDEFGIGGDI